MINMIRFPGLTRQNKLIIFSFAFVKFLLHFFSNFFDSYGYFRDELYYVACSNHLDLGYVDQPPLSIYLLKISRLFIGDSILALRLMPTLAGSACIIVTGIVVAELRGKSFAIFLACLAVFTSLIDIGMSSYFSMNSFDILIWISAAYILVRIINTNENKLWIVLGVLLGLGLLNKISVLFMGAGIFTGLIFTPERKWLRTPWPYIAGIIAFLIFSPYIYWNIINSFPHLEFIKNASAGKYSSLNTLTFIKSQLLINNPINFPIWMGGLLALLFFKPLKRYRLLGIIFLTTFLILILNRTSKGEYLAPAYSVLFAAGAVFFEKKLIEKRISWIKFAYPVLMFVSFLFFLPILIPILPVEKFISYSKAIGIKPPSNENKELRELPQFYADRFEWEEKVKSVAGVFNSLSQEEKEKCSIYSNNYGRCGAIDFFGKKYGLPNSIGGHNNYWIWGPGKYTGDVLLILGGELEEHSKFFESCKEAGQSECKYCMPYENHTKIFLCKGLKIPIKELWKSVKNFD